MFAEATECFKKQDYDSEASVFLNVYKLNPKNGLGKNTRKKFDSLPLIIIENIVASIVGKWNLDKSGSN